MDALYNPSVFHSSDVLVIGGAASGLAAAITARETAPGADIQVVDKACASRGWAGKAARTAGLFSYVSRECDPEQFIRYCVEEIGCWLNEQNLLREFAFSGEYIVSKLVQWGVDFRRDEKGDIACGKWPFGWVTAGIDPDLCTALASYAKKLGVRFEDHIVVTELLKNGERVVGACGFGLHTGQFHVFLAQTVVLACGSQNFDITPLWCSTGISQAMAFRAGAEMRNVEFACMGDFARRDPGGWLYYGAHGGAHTGHDHLFNARGENISKKWRPGFHSSYDPQAAYAWYKETAAGHGPVMADMRGFFSEEGKEFFKFHPEAQRRQMHQQDVCSYPYNNEYFEVVPGVISEMSCIKVDRQMAASLPGLFAVGDACGSGSARAGAVPAPPGKIHGTGFLNAFFTGMKGGAAAASTAGIFRAAGFVPTACQADINAVRQRVFAPLEHKEGYDAHTLIHELQEAVAPCDYSAIQTEKRIEQALELVYAVKEKLPGLAAKDLHNLSKCVDAVSMTLCAELYYKTCLVRTETRGFQLREDYPERDDAHWLKWITVKRVGDGMQFTTENIPLDRYALRPDETTKEGGAHA